MPNLKYRWSRFSANEPEEAEDPCIQEGIQEGSGRAGIRTRSTEHGLLSSSMPPWNHDLMTAIECFLGEEMTVSTLSVPDCAGPRDQEMAFLRAKLPELQPSHLSSRRKEGERWRKGSPQEHTVSHKATRQRKCCGGAGGKARMPQEPWGSPDPRPESLRLPQAGRVSLGPREAKILSC